MRLNNATIKQVIVSPATLGERLRLCGIRPYNEYIIKSILKSSARSCQMMKLTFGNGASFQTEDGNLLTANRQRH